MKILKGILMLGFILISAFTIGSKRTEIIDYVVDPQVAEIEFYWKNKDQEVIGNFSRLQSELLNENKKLIFAMNGGMYQKNRTPLGLYVEDGVQYQKLNTAVNSFGNFYMQPNGVFAILDNKIAKIVSTADFNILSKVKYATQSGPLLVHQQIINSHFKKGSTNLNIRNGVGILPDGKIIFAISKQPINFYDFAQFFLQKGCNNALYLDGYVSRAYIPSKNFIQTDGNFGAMIGVYKKEKQ